MLNIESIISDAIETCGFNWEEEIEYIVNQKVNEIVQTIPSNRWRTEVEAALDRREEDLENMIDDAIADYVQEQVDYYVD